MSTPNIITIRKKINEYDYIYFIIFILLNVYDSGLNKDVIRDIMSYISTPFHFKTMSVSTYKIRQHVNLMDFCVDTRDRREIDDINRQLSLMNFRDLNNDNHETINYDLSFLKNLIISSIDRSIKYILEIQHNMDLQYYINDKFIIHRRIDFQRENYMIVFTHPV